MEPWTEQSDKVSKQRPDTEKARALLKMIALREQRAQITPLPQFATLLAEELYEIVKELITGIMSVDGWKTASHELLIGYLAKFYPEFSTAEVMLLDQLREMRNDIAYRGVMINPEYLERNQQNISNAIQKLKQILNARLNKTR
ncbi:hypothetical protein HY489_05855 [Candidatus Woesearchaeota archaeon]|nr:hypothetical protein [Candidatus Woesearchaeota archaeon]